MTREAPRRGNDIQGGTMSGAFRGVHLADVVNLLAVRVERWKTRYGALGDATPDADVARVCSHLARSERETLLELHALRMTQRAGEAPVRMAALPLDVEPPPPDTTPGSLVHFRRRCDGVLSGIVEAVELVNDAPVARAELGRIRAVVDDRRCNLAIALTARRLDGAMPAGAPVAGAPSRRAGPRTDRGPEANGIGGLAG